jgi:hypothetical protein
MKKLIGYRKSTRKFKKYDAILEENGKRIYVPFGDNRYSTFQDKTGLGLYKTTGDKERRRLYRLRHTEGDKYSPSLVLLEYALVIIKRLVICVLS